MSSPPAANGHATRLPDIGPDVADDPAWAAAARASLAHTDARLDKRFDQDDGMDRILALRARAVDHLLKDAWLRCIPAEAPMALFAVGGYGRGELFPQSDVDVLVLASADTQQRHHEAVARFFAMLWDAGLPISHSVRSAAQCTAAAAADQTVLTALIEERLIVGEPVDEALLIDAIGAARVWPPRDFFVAKREELRIRHARFGDTSDNLEPNIKDGPGGLRDLHTLGWMALRTFGVRDLEPLVGMGHLGQDEAVALARERRALGRLRYGLHRVAGRAEERLRFDYQKTLAQRLGFADDAESLGVEKMMQGFYRSACCSASRNSSMASRCPSRWTTASPCAAVTWPRAIPPGRGTMPGRCSPCSPHGRPIRRYAACIRARRARWPRRCPSCRPIPGPRARSAMPSWRCCADRARWKRSPAWRGSACWGSGSRRSRGCRGGCSSTSSTSTRSTSTP